MPLPDTIRREATADELKAEIAMYLNPDCSVRLRYRHFCREVYNPRARNRVSHRTHSSARPFVGNDGKVYVRHQGKAHEITGTLVSYPESTGIRPFVADIRIKSDYLPKVLL